MNSLCLCYHSTIHAHFTVFPYLQRGDVKYNVIIFLHLLSSGTVFKADEDIFLLFLRIPEVLLFIFALSNAKFTHLVLYEMSIQG